MCEMQNRHKKAKADEYIGLLGFLVESDFRSDLTIICKLRFQSKLKYKKGYFVQFQSK